MVAPEAGPRIESAAPGAVEHADIERLETELRRAQLRIEGLHAQLELRLDTIRQLRSEFGETSDDRVARAEARAALAESELRALLATKTFRATRAARKAYERGRQVLASRRRDR